jgi:hypothetical protein
VRLSEGPPQIRVFSTTCDRSLMYFVTNLRFLYKAPYNHENAAIRRGRVPDPNAVTFVTARYAMKRRARICAMYQRTLQPPLPALAAAHSLIRPPTTRCGAAKGRLF